MSPDEARAVLLKAFVATGEVPEWAAQLTLAIDAPPRRRPWWRRLIIR